MASIPRTIDVVVTANVRRGASLAARAKKYDQLLDRGNGLKPSEINAIPDDLFNEMALECEEPEPAPTAASDEPRRPFLDLAGLADPFEAAVVKVLRKHIDHEVRVRGGNLGARGLR